MHATHEKTSRPRAHRSHDPLRCVLGIHRWEWWLHDDVCLRCVRCYRRYADALS
jgi:hypothetical protein